LNRQEILNDLRSMITGSVRAGEPMRNHTSWKIGGPAEIFVQPNGLRDLKLLILYAAERDLDITVIGNGSNLLVSDYGIRGMIIQIGKGMDHLISKGNRITAGAGVKLPRLALFGREKGLAGFEFASGIPGTVGGALVMNAGANGSCMADIVREVVTIDESGNINKFHPGELHFGYRYSNLREKSLTVVEATFEGTEGDKEAIRKVTEDYLARRKRTQPLNYPNAGSVFKNPPGDSAGRLIEMAGAKGLSVGDARVSTKHANFFINTGNATSKDMLNLIEKVQNLVLQKTGVKLSLEVQLVGEH